MIDYSFSFRELEYFLLIMTRVTCFIFIAPFFGMNNTPKRVKIGLGVFLSVLLYYVISPKQYAEYSSVFGYAWLVIKEAATGLIVGFSAQICLSITNFAGRMVDMEIGLSMVNQMDPTTKEHTTITGVFYQYMVMLLLIITGMYQFILKALVETFTLIPVTGAVFNTESLVQSMLVFLRDYIVIGFRICLPVFAVILLLNAILGILAKVAPQLNMFAVGIQLKILVGLGVLFLTIGMLPSAANFVFTEIREMMVAFVESLI